MDEETLGLYTRFWRLIAALRVKDWSEEELGLSRKEAIEKLVAPFAREQLGVALSPGDPKFLAEVERALKQKLASFPETPPPNIPPNLQELVKIHQSFLARRAEEKLKAAGIPTIEEQVEKAHQHLWRGYKREVDEEGQIRTTAINLDDWTHPVEPEIPGGELIQEKIYHLLRKNDLLDDVGQPDPKAWEKLTESQKLPAQEELAPLLHFDELTRHWEPALVEYNPAKYPPRYPTHVYWALEETPALLFYPERHKRLAVVLGREYAQKVNDQFYKVYNDVLKETQGDHMAAQKAAHKAAEISTTDLFENQSVIKDAVMRVFEPLKLSNKKGGELEKITNQVIESLRGYNRRDLNPLTDPRGYLKSLLPTLPKEARLDVDPAGRTRLRVYPLGQPQNETTYWSEPTQQGLVNRAIKELTGGPFGSEAFYLREQLEYFMYNPIGAVTRWITVDPAIGAIEALVPGAKQLHMLYVDYQLKKGEIMRWYRVTPQLWYLFKETLKKEIGIPLGLYKEAMVGTKIKPVFTPWAWAGKATSAPFSWGAGYFFGRSERTTSLFRKRFWFGLSQAFHRREQDWDRSPLVLLIKLVVDLTLGTIGRLIQRAGVARLAKIWTRLTETGFGKRFLGGPTMRAFRATVRIGKIWTRSLFSVNTLSGGVLGYAIGAPLGVPQLGAFIGGASGWHYEFYLRAAKNEHLMAWLREPSTHFTSRWIRRIVGKPTIWLAEHPYARFPIKGLALGYVLYLMGFPAWVIPLMGGAHWAWSTRGWWGPIVRTGLEKIPGVGRLLGRLIGFLSKFRLLGLIGKLLSWAFPVITTSPLILDILSGTPPLIALQKWFSGPLYLGQLTMFEVVWLAKGLWWPLLKSGLLAAINFIIPDVVALWLYETIPAIVAAITSVSVLTLVSIGLLVIVSGFTIYLITSAFFVERAISARVISPYLPIEKTVTPVKDQNGEIIALDYTLTFTYNPPSGTTAMLDNIKVLDRFELPAFDSIPGIFGDMRAWAINPSPPGCEYVLDTDPTLPKSFGWYQKRSIENPTKICPWLGPLTPGESQTITLHLPLKNPPLSNYLQGEEMLCDTLAVFGQIQGGENLSSSSPPVCINAAGEIWVFGWPTCYHDCSSNYGYRPDPDDHRRCELHAGIDLPPNPQGGCTDIHPAARGTILEQNYHPNYGCYVIIEHRDNLYTLYGHLADDRFNCRFNFGEDVEVTPNDIIGTMGNSGHSTGPHLHFGVSQCGSISCFLYNKAGDPCNYLPNCPNSCRYQSLIDCEGITR